MKFTTLFLLFTPLLILLTFLASIILNLLEVGNMSGLNVAIFLASTALICIQYGRKNEFYFTTKQKWIVVFGFVIISAVWEYIYVLLIMPTNQELKATLLLATLVIALLHLPLAYLGVHMAKKQLIKDGVI